MMKKNSHNTASAGVSTNIWSPIIRGAIVIVLGVDSFIFWAMQAPLGMGMATDNTVTASSNRKTVQHLSGGRVTDIFIKEGDFVKKNQALVRLDKMQLEMRFNALNAQYISAKSIEDCLSAERNGLEAIVFNTTLAQQFSGNKRLTRVRNLQARLFDTHHKAIQDELSMIEETLDDLVGQTDNLSKIKGYRDRQFPLINRKSGAIRALSEKNYYPRAQLLVLEREAAEVSGSASEDIFSIARLKSQQDELKTRAYQVRHQYLREVESGLTEDQKEAAILEDEPVSAHHELDNTEIRSPINGIVLDVKISTAGGVIQPGEYLIDIVAAGQSMQINTKIPVHAIDKLVPGLTVDVLFPAPNHALLPSVPARVLTILTDRLIDEATQQPYYLAEVQVLVGGARLLDDYEAKAEMPASVAVKTGERTLMSYLFKSLITRLELASKGY